MVKRDTNTESLSSSGHRLGQIVGDWWEVDVIFPLLKDAANKLNLYLDNRTVSRSCRKDKIQWADSDGNFVDYDYVLEVNGTNRTIGTPVGFIESFWRRGARHSKDKARDDTNKLLPMRSTYPTARLLAIAACGEFTEPARDYVRSRNVELFFLPKEKIMAAFKAHGLEIDYPDSLSEKEKQKLVKAVELRFSKTLAARVTSSLHEICGRSTFTAFQDKITGSLSAQPQQIRVYMLTRSEPAIFDNIKEACRFLASPRQTFDMGKGVSKFDYEVVFSDGSEFSRGDCDFETVRKTNLQLAVLVEHIKAIS